MHIVIIEFDDQTTDVVTYCSDWFARHNPAYQGWYGCVEPQMGDVCNHCNRDLSPES